MGGKPRHDLPHIDGLRAIAVMAVIVFHLFPAYAPGGFCGVDVFFVISGFLISRIIFAESAGGKFSLLNFYERRARRILPAFYVVTLVVLFGGFFLLFPPEFVNLAQSAIASALFSGNIYFFTQTGYFKPDASTLPLLHYWTLGVEWQFYFLFPPIVLLIRRMCSRYLPHVVGILCIASLIASEVMLSISYSAAYYLVPYRAFELLIGSLLALRVLHAPAASTFGWRGTAVGLVMVVGFIFLANSHTPFPGAIALIPCLGATLIIWGGVGANFLGVGLGSAVPRYLGEISYSLYLIHWPVKVFADRIFPDLNAVSRGTIALTLTVILSVLSYRFIERPFQVRRWSAATSRRILATGSAMAIAIPIALSTWDSSFGQSDVEKTRLLSYLSYDFKPDFQYRKCFLEIDQSADQFDAQACLPKPSGKSVIVWGDSHAADLMPGLRPALEEVGYSVGQITYTLCAPVLGREEPDKPNCKAFNDFAIKEIEATKPKLVILSAYWIISGNDFDLLRKTIARLRSSGITVVVVGEAPMYRATVPAILAMRLDAKDTSRYMDVSGLDPHAMASNALLRKEIADTGATYVSIIDQFCSSGYCPLELPNGTPIVFDTAHFTAAGSRALADVLSEAILRAGSS